MVCDALKSHDLSSARAFMVPSVPGNHEGTRLMRYGHLRVQDLCSKVCVSLCVYVCLPWLQEHKAAFSFIA